jgi:hypothetical protein
MANNTENSTHRDKRIANLKPPWKKGQSGNPRGPKIGQRPFAVLYREALLKLAKANNMEPDELELEILANGLLNARRGDYRFFKDVLDRIHGKAIERKQIGIGGKDSITDLIAMVEGEEEENDTPRSDQSSQPTKKVEPLQPPIPKPAEPPKPVDELNKPNFPLPTA